MRCSWCNAKIHEGHESWCIAHTFRYAPRLSLDIESDTIGNVIGNFFKKEQPKMRTMTRRFYVGSSNIASTAERDGSHPILKTLQEATEQAKNKVSEGLEEVLYIVEVVRIVKRPAPRPPIEIEDVRRA